MGSITWVDGGWIEDRGAGEVYGWRQDDDADTMEPVPLDDLLPPVGREPTPPFRPLRRRREARWHEAP